MLTVVTNLVEMHICTGIGSYSTHRGKHAYQDCVFLSEYYEFEPCAEIMYITGDTFVYTLCSLCAIMNKKFKQLGSLNR